MQPIVTSAISLNIANTFPTMGFEFYTLSFVDMSQFIPTFPTTIGWPIVSIKMWQHFKWKCKMGHDKSHITCNYYDRCLLKRKIIMKDNAHVCGILEIRNPWANESILILNL